MVSSVDRNTLISQIVSLNPQLKPDELRKLSDAQLQAKLSQLIAGAKQGGNVDKVLIQNQNPNPKPLNIHPNLGMSDDQAETTTIDVIHQNVSEAEEIYSKANFGGASKLYDSMKSEDNKLSSTNVRKVLNYQNQGMKFLIDSQYGNLSRKEYYLQSRQHLKEMILTRLFVLKTPTGESMLDSSRGKYSKDEFAKIIDEYLDGILANKDLEQLKQFQKKLVSDNNYETKFLTNVVTSASKPTPKAKTGTARGTEVGYKGINDDNKGIPNNWLGNEAISFEEVYQYERGIEYSKDNVERFTIAQANMNFVSSAYNKFQQFNQFADKASDNTLSSKQKEQMILDGFSAYYYLSEDNGRSEMNKLLEKSKLPTYVDETGFVFPANMTEENKQKILNQFVLHAKQNEQQKLDKILKGKSIDEYAQEYQSSANALLGEDDAVMMANAMKEDNLEGFKKYTSMAQIGGMGLTLVGGVLTFTPLSPLGVGMITVGNTVAMSGMGADIVNDYTNEFTKDKADAESLENTNKQTLMTVGGFVIGAKAGKYADKVFQKTLGDKLISTFGKDYANGNKAQALKNLVSSPENFAKLAKAVGGKVGTDFGISYMGDLAMMGVLNTNDDWESLLKSNLMGVLVSTGSDLKGLAKTRGKAKVDDVKTKPSEQSTEWKKITIQGEDMEFPVTTDANGNRNVDFTRGRILTVDGEYKEFETTSDAILADTSDLADGGKTFTQEEAAKLAAQDPEHIKVMSNGKVFRITDSFEFIHIGNVDKNNISNSSTQKTKKNTNNAPATIKDIIDETKPRRTVINPEKELKEFIENEQKLGNTVLSLEDSEISYYANDYKNNPELFELALKTTQLDSNGNVQSRFRSTEIPQLIAAYEENPKLFASLFDEKIIEENGQETFRFDAYEMRQLTEKYAKNPEITSLVINEKEMDIYGNLNPRFSAGDIEELEMLNNENPSLFKELLNAKTVDKNGYSKSSFSVYKMYKIIEDSKNVDWPADARVKSFAKRDISDLDIWQNMKPEEVKSAIDEVILGNSKDYAPLSETQKEFFTQLLETTKESPITIKMLKSYDFNKNLRSLNPENYNKVLAFVKKIS